MACGAVAKRLLAEFGIRVESHVLSIGTVSARVPSSLPEDLNAASDASPVRTLDARAEDGDVPWAHRVRAALVVRAGVQGLGAGLVGPVHQAHVRAEARQGVGGGEA